MCACVLSWPFVVCFQFPIIDQYTGNRKRMDAQSLFLRFRFVCEASRSKPETRKKRQTVKLSTLSFPPTIRIHTYLHITKVNLDILI
ncbi:uncharacterized protein F4807DRAFT_1218 [Annulohypoxylon truncatum]|uniref:uncharacterized protein n=1 Tax=Annulohypoxylon truncatum TaxID=327061 RepID=UPI0020087EEC|nr:uncharacterized protein F4807DRAFT_1218 [Annulohypoxylon truncatum]KAI1214541.1 hypothetical protein F4807DRAFT_1218 [Annulohypoxylon truncatum]